MSIKKTLTTAPPPIQAKVDFFSQVQDLKDQHEKHEEKKEIIVLKAQHQRTESFKHQQSLVQN